MNTNAITTIFLTEMTRTRRTLLHNIIAPIISTALYFVVFGKIIGSQISVHQGIRYIDFIIPGLMMVSLLAQSFSFGATSIYFPKSNGSIYELLSAPISCYEILFSYLLTSTTKSITVSLIILATAEIFSTIKIDHPFWMIYFLLLIATAFSTLGFIIGMLTEGFEKISVVPLFIITPLTYLGGSFYPINILPPFWKNIALFNPVTYLMSGLRWSFYGISDVRFEYSIAISLGLLVLFLAIVARIFKNGYHLTM